MNSKIFSYLSIELTVVIFVFSGVLKQILGILGLGGLDLTLFSILAFSILWCFKSKEKKHDGVNSLVFFLFLFCWWALFSWLYTTAVDSIFLYKYFGFLSGYIIFVMLIFLKDINPERFWNIFNFFSALSAIALLLILPIYYSLSNDLNSDYRSIYLSIPFFLSITIFDIYYKQFYCKVEMKYYIFNIIILLLCLFAIIISGARGPIIALLFSVIVMNLFHKKGLSRILFLSFIFFISSYIFFFLFYDKFGYLIERTGLRFLTLFDGGFEGNERYELLNFSLEKISNSFSDLMFGFGFASFGQEYFGIPVYAYPHNIIIEVLFELGLVGMIFFVISNLSIMIFFRRYLSVFVLSLIALMVINYLKSYSLVGFRNFIIILFFIFQLSRSRKYND